MIKVLKQTKTEITETSSDRKSMELHRHASACRTWRFRVCASLGSNDDVLYPLARCCPRYKIHNADVHVRGDYTDEVGRSSASPWSPCVLQR